MTASVPTFSTSERALWVVNQLAKSFPALSRPFTDQEHCIRRKPYPPRAFQPFQHQLYLTTMNTGTSRPPPPSKRDVGWFRYSIGNESRMHRAWWFLKRIVLLALGCVIVLGLVGAVVIIALNTSLGTRWQQDAREFLSALPVKWWHLPSGVFLWLAGVPTIRLVRGFIRLHTHRLENR